MALDLVHTVGLDDTAYQASLRKMGGSANRTFGRIGSTVSKQTEGIRSAAGAVTGLAGVFTGMLGVVTLVGGAVGGVVALLNRGSERAQRMREAFRGVAEASIAIRSEVAASARGVADLELRYGVRVGDASLEDSIGDVEQRIASLQETRAQINEQFVEAGRQIDELRIGAEEHAMAIAMGLVDVVDPRKSISLTENAERQLELTEERYSLERSVREVERGRLREQMQALDAQRERLEMIREEVRASRRREIVGGLRDAAFDDGLVALRSEGRGVEAERAQERERHEERVRHLAREGEMLIAVGGVTEEQMRVLESAFAAEQRRHDAAIASLDERIAREKALTQERRERDRFEDFRNAATRRAELLELRGERAKADRLREMQRLLERERRIRDDATLTDAERQRALREERDIFRLRTAGGGLLDAVDASLGGARPPTRSPTTFATVDAGVAGSAALVNAMLARRVGADDPQKVTAEQVKAAAASLRSIDRTVRDVLERTRRGLTAVAG